MNFTPDVNFEDQKVKPPKKFSKKAILIAVSLVLVVCIFAATMWWIGFVNQNPFVEIAFAAAKTFKTSAKAELVVSSVSRIKSEEAFSEIVFANDDGKLGLTSVSDDGTEFYLDGEYVFLAQSDGTASITKYYDRKNDVEDSGKKKDIQYFVRFLNKNIFEEEILNPEETEKRSKEIAKHYGNRDYLEENLGFSVDKENGEKIFSFNFGLTDFVAIIRDMVYNSEEIFNKKENYEALLSVLKIASSLSVDSEISLDIRIKKGRISSFVLSAKTFDGNEEKRLDTYSLVFSEYGESVLDKDVLDEFSEHKDILGEFKSYKRKPDGQVTFTDKDGKKHDYFKNTITVYAVGKGTNHA